MKGLIASVLLVLAGQLQASSVPSPFNGRTIPPVDSSGSYRLVFSGHFHGASDNTSGFPAATLLAGIDLLNGLGTAALISTGDLFLSPDRDSARYRTSLFERLRMPLYNAPGNHDKEGKAFGAIMYPQWLDIGTDVVLLLDTERDDSDISGDQLQALERLAQQAERGLHRRIYIVSHRPVWAEDDKVYGPLFSGNTRSLTGCNYTAAVFPLVQRMAAHAEVFWVSGSMAGGAPASVFFQRHAPNITYIQSAIRNELRDAVLVLDATPSGTSWNVVSLTGASTRAAGTYDAAFWKANRRSGEQPFNWRLLPYLVRSTVTHRAFVWGLLCATLFWGLLRVVRRRWV
jgi:hypothetical protein